jgi:hypothetical protein
MEFQENMEADLPGLELWPSIMTEEVLPTSSAQSLGSDYPSKLGDGDNHLSTRGSEAVQEIAHHIREMVRELYISNNYCRTLNDLCTVRESCIRR